MDKSELEVLLFHTHVRKGELEIRVFTHVEWSIQGQADVIKKITKTTDGWKRVRFCRT